MLAGLVPHDASCGEPPELSCQLQLTACAWPLPSLCWGERQAHLQHPDVNSPHLLYEGRSHGVAMDDLHCLLPGVGVGCFHSQQLQFRQPQGCHGFRNPCCCVGEAVRCAASRFCFEDEASCFVQHLLHQLCPLVDPPCCALHHIFHPPAPLQLGVVQWGWLDCCC